MDVPVTRVVRPGDIDEALAMLAADPRALPLAGGTDLLVQLRAGRRPAAVLVDISHLGLAAIRERDGGLEIGAGTTMEALAVSAPVRSDYPALAAAAALVGAWPVGNRATIGGNLANASPAADTAPPLLVAGARLRLACPGGAREIALADFFLAPGRTALRPGELITAVLLPPPPAGRRHERFDKLGARREQVISIVSFAGRVVVRADGTLREVALACGAVAPRPLRLSAVERCLEGARPDGERRRQAVEALQRDITPIDDVRGSARYRRMAAAVLLDRFLEDAGV